MVSHGRFTAVMPGPTVIPERVLNAMHRAPPNIYGPESAGWSKQLKEDLCTVAKTSQHVAMYVGNGHAAWEAALQNLFTEGDMVLNLEIGYFSKAWGEMAVAMGVEVETLQAALPSEAIDPAVLERRLRDDKEHKIKAVLSVHADTATTVLNDIKALRAAIDAAQHPALLLVDAIGTMACIEVDFDGWGVDVCVAGSQKGFMVPPGCSFTFVSDKAMTARSLKRIVPQYFDWQRRIAFDGKAAANTWGGTPPTHHIFGLAESLEMILREEGLEQVWARHEILAESVWAAVEAWGRGGPIRLFVPLPAQRSRTVTLVCIDGHDCSELCKWCLEETNLLLSKPVGGDIKTCFRIGHMGHLNPPMLLGCLATIDCGLKALGIPHGAGALDAASQIIATRLAKLPRGRSVPAIETMTGGSRLPSDGPVKRHKSCAAVVPRL